MKQNYDYNAHISSKSWNDDNDVLGVSSLYLLVLYQRLDCWAVEVYSVIISLFLQGGSYALDNRIVDVCSRLAGHLENVLARNRDAEDKFNWRQNRRVYPPLSYAPWAFASNRCTTSGIAKPSFSLDRTSLSKSTCYDS